MNSISSIAVKVLNVIVVLVLLFGTGWSLTVKNYSGYPMLTIVLAILSVAFGYYTARDFGLIKK